MPTTIFFKEQKNLPLFLPLFFGFGAAFFFLFPENFSANLFVFVALLVTAGILYFWQRAFIYLLCASFLLGSFYAKIYPKPKTLTGKIFVEVVGKVESVKKFSNPVNGVEGMNLVVSELKLSKVNSFSKKKNKAKKPRKISAKKIEKDFVNLEGYQEIDRQFLDHSKSYQASIPKDFKRISVSLSKNLTPPQFVPSRHCEPSSNWRDNPSLVTDEWIASSTARSDEEVDCVGVGSKSSNEISVNDKITFRALLQPPKQQEFPEDFNYAFYDKLSKINARGFVTGEVKILEKGRASNFDEWFLDLREQIRQKISKILNGDEAATAAAFLIGDQAQISKDLADKIRNSGLAHLLSISGFHLSLAGAIFFVVTRFALSRSEYLVLNFDLKKISAAVAILATYFYLKIAGSPLPAQRAFLFILFTFLAMFVSEKLDAKRATIFGALLLILLNPYVIFSASFQLSFVAVLVLVNFSKAGRNYFWQILLLSILIQIATLPFLMHHFRNLALLGFVANLAAIPLTSFVVMPFGFLALFLMPLGLEKLALLPMREGIFLLTKIAEFVSNISYSHLTSPWLPSSGLVLASTGLLLICLTKSLRLIGLVIFTVAFLTVFLVKKPDVIFEQNQKFFAVYDEENGLRFSKKLRASRQRQKWIEQFVGKGSGTLREPDHVLPCEKNRCEVEVKNQKILVLLTRNKLSEICKSNFDVIVNLSRKYELPDCISENKIKLDNGDFLDGKTKFLFFENEKFRADEIH